MNSFFGWAQLGALAAFLALFLGRALQLRLGQGIRVINMVRGKPWRRYWPRAIRAAMRLQFMPKFHHV